MTETITPQALDDQLADGGEIAVIDLREHGQYGEAHLLFCVSIPFSRLELSVGSLVPNRSTRVVVYDQDDGEIAGRATDILRSLGYRNVRRLQGGADGWKAAGYRLFAGVNVPSKAFGEMIAENFDTPAITADELAKKQQRGEKVVILDGRPWEEFHAQSIPGATSCPNGELIYRIQSLVDDDQTEVVINCAGRTRSIIGCEMLRQYGIKNPVYALRNGTMGWRLSGREINKGARQRAALEVDSDSLSSMRPRVLSMAERAGAAVISADMAQKWIQSDERTTYLLDVRDPQEFRREHLAGARSAPGGQLIQATDEWIGVRRARVVLVDDTEVRAAACAYWLSQMDYEVYILKGGKTAWWATESGTGTDNRDPVGHRVVDAATAADRLMNTPETQLLDCQAAMAFRKAHANGARWVIRPNLPAQIGDLDPSAPTLVMGSGDGREQLIANDLVALGYTDVTLVSGGIKAWTEAGQDLVASPDTPSDSEAIDYLFFVHDRHAGNLEAAKQYLAWEHGLVPSLTERDLEHYRLAPINT